MDLNSPLSARHFRSFAFPGHSVRTREGVGQLARVISQSETMALEKVPQRWQKSQG